MNLIRLLLLALAVWLVFVMLRRLGRPARPTLNPPQDTVRCARCGLHVPRAEALEHRGQHYCSAEHRDQH